MALAQQHSGGSRHRVPRRSGRRIVWFSVAGLAVLLIAAVAWVGVRGLLAKDELEAAVPLASSIPEQIIGGDPVTAGHTSEKLSGHAASAVSLTGDPVWRAAELLPWVGGNLTAVREVAGIVDQLATDAIDPLVSMAGSIGVDQFKPVDGAIALQPLLDAQPAVSQADVAVKAALQRTRSIDTDGTVDVVSAAVVELEGVVGEAESVTDAINRAVTLLPAALGADGPRNYLMLFQNPAEPRSGGGIPGALAMLHTEGGAIELTEQASSSDFPHFDEPVLPLPIETEGLYGSIVGEYIQNVTLTPHFAMSGALAQEMWRLQYGTTVDGVISVDPVALSYLLRATGPITLATGDVLTSDNAVQLLLSDVYARYEDPAMQDLFFAAAAAAVFDTVASGQGDPVKLISALAQAGQERRLLVWSSAPEEQAVLEGTTLAGELPVSGDAGASDATSEWFGVYLNDATGSKMGMHLDVQLGAGQVTCRQDGRPHYAIDVTLTNTAPADAATSLPEYVTGGGWFGVTPGHIKSLVAVYGPTDSQNLGLFVNGVTAEAHPTTDDGHPVTLKEVELVPGESVTLRAMFLGAAEFDGDIWIDATPFVNRNLTQELAITCEVP
ncbi:DUF4012 domain-containing protein [Salinibacterium sp. ZJ450]|uniref:DUF4012 domain-containing protein n=1 Tax=Salinibacterium sp. ZJ450 TaxID=2708338 RepID=UPI0014246B10|nr:DUF4012 domain-containing protein [Salinibacterium sp. ZJ450]